MQERIKEYASIARVKFHNSSYSNFSLILIPYSGTSLSVLMLMFPSVRYSMPTRYRVIQIKVSFGIFRIFLVSALYPSYAMPCSVKSCQAKLSQCCHCPDYHHCHHFRSTIECYYECHGIRAVVRSHCVRLCARTMCSCALALCAVVRAHYGYNVDT